MEQRKQDHISLAFDSHTGAAQVDPRFYYEPMLSEHPQEQWPEFSFLNKTMHAPLWISSMTGGTEKAKRINTQLARAANEFGLGMGLGSCRIVMEDDKHLPDFDLRPIIGPEQPLFANLGIAQIEQRVLAQDTQAVHDLVHLLKADGLIIHINPMQEWFQPEGDRLKQSPLLTIQEFLKKADYPVIIKEVGQGMGYESLKALLQLPLAAVDFGAFGGTNFAKLELLRNPDADKALYEPFALIGHTATEMLELTNQIHDEHMSLRTPQIIVSGGIKSFMDGYYCITKSKLPAIYGMASGFLAHAQGNYSELQQFVSNQIKGLVMARAYLQVK